MLFHVPMHTAHTSMYWVVGGRMSASYAGFSTRRNELPKPKKALTDLCRDQLLASREVVPRRHISKLLVDSFSAFTSRTRPKQKFASGLTINTKKPSGRCKLSCWRIHKNSSFMASCVSFSILFYFLTRLHLRAMYKVFKTLGGYERVNCVKILPYRDCFLE